MALRDAVLATLLEGDASGYDLAKAFDRSVASFWMATPQQVYRELDRMVDDGLIDCRVVQQDRRPNKRVFSLTDAGHDALRAFTAEPARTSAMRDDLMVKVQAVDDGDIEAVRGWVAQRLALAEEKVDSWERLRVRILHGREEDDFFDTAERVGPYLTLTRGIAYERENITWAQLAIRVLERRQRLRDTSADD